MTCPADTSTIYLRSQQRPDDIQPGDLVFVRVGDTLHLEGTQPDGPVMFWRVCRPDTMTAPPVTLPPMSPPASPPPTTEQTTTTAGPTTTYPWGPVHCETDEVIYDGTDVGVCEQLLNPTPPAELAVTGVDLGPVAVLGALLIAAGALIALNQRKKQR